MFLPLVFITVLLKGANVHAQGDASSACGNVLQQGVYNTISSSSTTTTYSQLQSSMCSFSSSMTYQEYLSAGSSGQSSSTYDNWNADASFLGISAGGGHSGGNSQMTASQFEEFQKAAASYQSQYCGSSSSSSGSSDLFNSYMQCFLLTNLVCLCTVPEFDSLPNMDGVQVALSLTFSLFPLFWSQGLDDRFIYCP
jgi:hypothetical protein